MIISLDVIKEAYTGISQDTFSFKIASMEEVKQIR